MLNRTDATLNCSAGFMMVEKFGYEVHEITLLYLINLVINILVAPLLFLRRAARRKPISAPIAGMAVIMGGNFVYMIPNSTFSPIAVIMLGAIAAFVQFDVVNEGAEAPKTPGSERPRSRYSRFSHSHITPGADEMPSRVLTRPALRPSGRT